MVVTRANSHGGDDNVLEKEELRVRMELNEARTKRVEDAIVENETRAKRIEDSLYAVLSKLGITTIDDTVTREIRSESGVELNPERDKGGSRWRKLEILIFGGEDAYGWILKLERYFELRGVADDERMQATLLALEGKALSWFQWWERCNPTPTWEGFKLAVIRRFQPVMVQNPFELLLSLKQSNTVEAYVEEFERYVGALKEIDQDFAKGIFLNGLKEEIRVEKPSWEKAAKIIKERYDPEMDGRILLGKVDCTQEGVLCRRHHIQGYPSIRIFRKGTDVRSDHGHHEHESYYGDRDVDSLVKTMETLVASLPAESQKLALEDKSNVSDGAKRPAPSAGGCRIEGYVRVKKVPGNLIISARSDAHSFDASQMNMSHVINHLSFGRKVSPRVMSDVKRLIPYVGNSHDRLNGQSFINTHDLGANVTIEHYLQVVKTEVVTRKDYKLVEEYEYTAHSSVAQSLHIPVAKFQLELSPMQVLITENQKSFSHFITNICAIIGGIFTVAGIMDSILHNTLRMMKKVELGKNF
ncbi:protein disulfide-isomerase 5-3-like isoform X1 [Lotus japonicus]|nr:protein disulfide-isomerase 5-3-like isoform X1 [Lotus japonicus]